VLLLVQLVVKAIAAGDQLVLDDARRIGQYRQEASVDDPGDLANRLFHTVYMGTENSSVSTRSRWGRS
jgi:NAD+ synthase (glutamine-hydrolysing)